MKVDRQATAARKFHDKRSYVAPDGRDVLYGRDWDDRRYELLLRSGGQCERIILGSRCWRDAEDPHHVTLRSILRDDRMTNLLAVCRRCHVSLDQEQRKIHGKNKIHFRPEAA